MEDKNKKENIEIYKFWKQLAINLILSISIIIIIAIIVAIVGRSFFQSLENIDKKSDTIIHKYEE